MATAVITGGAVRLGKAMALHLAKRGMDIAFTYMSSEKQAEETLQELQLYGVKGKKIRFDAEDIHSAAFLMEEIHREFSDCELLINSASIFPFKQLQDTDDATMQSIININLLTPLALMREFFRITQKGQIVNILDQRIMQNNPSHALYSISKVALAHATHLGAVEFGSTLRVNGIAPGLVLPPPGKDNAFLERMSKKVPIGKRGEPEHILKALDYLLDNSFVHGEILYVDGGESKGEKYD